MAIQDISNLAISASFQSLLQVSGSQVGTAVGDIVTDLDITSSFATTASFVESALSSSHADTANTAGSASFATTALSATSADSASVATTADSATSASYATNSDIAISASFATTASHALNVITVDTGSLLQTASISDATITFEKADGSTFDLTVDNVDTAVSASHAVSALSSSHALKSDLAHDANDLIVSVKNTSGSPIAKGDVLHATGVTGENINVELADNTNAASMPGFAIANEAISTNSSGQAIVSGKIIGINTDGLTAGANVYVNANGGFTGTKPTGSALIQNIGIVGKVNASEGELIVLGSGRSNDVPNITENYLWVGNSNGVATPTDKDALTVGTASLALDVISTANLNITSISASSANFQSASIGFLESVTGSAKIIGDAFIILNNDTPTERYAGIVVQDSGSGAPNTTASFEWDGQTNDWFYHYEGDDPTDFSIAMFGPEYTTKGSPVYPSNNTLVKGDGGHHLNDSNITDDGSTIVLGSDSEVTGSLGVTGTITGTLNGQASTAISASHAVQADSALAADTATSASHALIADNAPVINSITYPTTDGTDGQAIVTDGLGTLTFQDIAGDPAGATDTGTTLAFDNAIGTIYNTAATGATGNITLSTTNAVVGAAAVIFHEDSTEPTVSGMTVDKKIGSYDTSALNIITFVHLGNNHVLQTIAGADVTGIVTNSTDTYTSVDDVQHIVTLTAAEYSAIGTPDANTFYIVT